MKYQTLTQQDVITSLPDGGLVHIRANNPQMMLNALKRLAKRYNIVL